MNVNKTDNEKRHKCTFIGCSAAFNRPYRLTQHILVHNDFRTFVCFVAGCDKSYTSKSHLDRHMNAVHFKTDTGVVYSCPTCLKSYSNRQNLKRHINATHVKNIPFYCDLCKLHFKKKHQLTAHMHQHTGIKAFNCEFCAQEFVSLPDKKKHMRHHKTYNCDECAKVFSQWSTYQYHKGTVHAKTEFICDICGRVFKERCNIVRHMKIHKEKNIKVFLCLYDKCYREYSRKSNLKQHILMKHQQVKHDCHVCPAKLSTKAALDRHLKNHLTPREKKPPKTLANGRKPRKDIGAVKKPGVLKLAGLELPYHEENTTPGILEASMSLYNSMVVVEAGKT